MSQKVMDELVNQSQEIIKLKDEKRELLKALIDLHLAVLGWPSRCDLSVVEAQEKARAAIAKAEGVLA